MSAAAMNDSHPSDGLPKRTTPTWEVELLISGVAVFAMLQLPGWLDGMLFATSPRVGGGLDSALSIMHIYLKAAALILAATFAVHLLLRAQWIALVGAYSVFPDGVRWDRLRMGPIRMAVERRKAKSAAETIDAADNRATIVFGLGVSMASSLLWITLSIAGLFGLALGATRLLGYETDAGRIFVLCAGAFAVPLMIAMQLDRMLGPKLSPESALWRAAAFVLDIYRRLGVNRGANVLGLIASHGGETRTTALTVGIMLVGMATAVFTTQWGRDPRSLGDYASFPAAMQTVDPSHYDDQRDPARDGAVPYLQSPVIVGPYAKLVVPYRPAEDDAILRRHCPGTRASGEAGDAAALACLSAAHALRLDGEPLTGQAYEISEDPRTDRPALLAMIDVRALAPGRHVLTVDRASTSKNGKANEPYAIPFWR